MCFISGPGTTMMYQQFLRDGSVVVNLGGNKGYMDEFIAEGASYLRALYARMPLHDALHGGVVVRELAMQARDLVFKGGGFAMPTPCGLNLSPTATMLKTYAHLIHPDIDPLTPLTHIEGMACVGMSFMDSFTFTKSPLAEQYKKTCQPTNPCLMNALGEDYNHQDPKHMSWFQ